MAWVLSKDLRERVVMAVVRGGMSRHQAAARFGVTVSTANIWVKRFLATGSLDHGQIGGHKPATLSGEHCMWMLSRCAGGDFTCAGWRRSWRPSGGSRSTTSRCGGSCTPRADAQKRRSTPANRIGRT